MSGQAVGLKRILPPVSRDQLVEEDATQLGGDDAVGDIGDGYLRPTRKDIEFRLRRLLKILKKQPQKFSRKSLTLSASPGALPKLDLALVAKMLGRDSLLRHQNGLVKMLVARSIVELLRIFAPDAPYGEDKLVDVFSLFLRQISSIGKVDELQPERVKLLERLARIQAFCLVRCETDVLGEAILCLQSAVVPTSSDAYRSSVVSCLTTIASEAPEITSEMLENLLNPLHSPGNDQASSIALEVFRSCAAQLAEPVQRHLRCIVNKSRSNGGSFETKGQWRMFLALACEVPNLEKDALQSLAEDLRSPDYHLRKKRVQQFAEIFSRPGSKTAECLPQTYEVFLTRFLDAESSIRWTCCDYGGKILHEAVESDALKAAQQLKGRVLDTDEQVRAASVRSIFQEIDSDRVDRVTLLSAMSRLLDKKPTVRKETSEQVQNFFRCQVLNPEEWAGEKVRIVLGEICSFMRVCPAGASSLEALIDCFIVNHAKLDQRCEGLDKQSTLNRVKCFFRNVSGLSDDALSTIGSVVKRRSRSRNAILLAISSRWSPSRNTQAPTLELPEQPEVSKRKCAPHVNDDNLKSVDSVCQLLCDTTERTKRCLSDVLNVKDKLVLSRTVQGLSLEGPLQEIEDACSDAVKRVGSKSPAGDFLRRILFPRSRPAIFTAENVAEILRSLLDGRTVPGIGDRESVPSWCNGSSVERNLRWFLDLTADFYGDVFEGLVDEIMGMTKNSSTRLTALRVLPRIEFAEACSAHGSHIEVLEKFCSLPYSAAEAKFSSRSILRLRGVSPELVNSAIERQTCRTIEALDDFDIETLPQAFAVGAELARSFAQDELGQKIVEKLFSVFSEMAIGRLFSAADPVEAVMISGMSAISQVAKLPGKDAWPWHGKQDSDTHHPPMNMILKRVLLRDTPLFSLLSKGGTEEVALRTQAAKLLVKLSRTGALSTSADNILIVARFVKTAEPELAEKLSRWIFEGITRKKTPFKWTCAILFANFDGKATLVQALVASLRAAVARMQIDEAQTDVYCTLPFLPESVLPTLVWVLAKDAGEFQGLGRENSPLRSFLSFLVENAEHASLTKSVLETLKVAEDSGNDSALTDRIRAVATHGLDQINSKIERERWEVEELSFQLGLPRSLFKARKTTRSEKVLTSNPEDRMTKRIRMQAR
uniref:Sister chromatid cohesion protein n=1 Tax=Rhodosorus marinus TaxID=101924 RepID=A0A7S3A5C5_9RHOD|mmetsp:Transcript_45353/g.176175  ORF Transcript_45353/g.176175 Transcript_45353/m.176175 type:complete len:1164 (+) Transcript_45353:230-3721(+)